MRRLIDLDDYRNCYIGMDGEYEHWNIDPDVIAEAQAKPLTHKEQMIFLAAMNTEEKVCKVVDEETVHEAYEDTLTWICKEIIRKVKIALWA